MSQSATKDVVIDHNLGLHLRAAGALVQMASRFDCEIVDRVHFDGFQTVLPYRNLRPVLSRPP